VTGRPGSLAARKWTIPQNNAKMEYNIMAVNDEQKTQA
jgi:hypothetical protein